MRSFTTHHQLIRSAYDSIALDYDACWSVHVAEPQARLTRELRVEPGERCADLGCGTGLDTLELVKLAEPGEVVGVDLSPEMLAAARARARAAGLELTTVCQGAEEFAQCATPDSFDVITLRFCIGQLDWRSLLPCVPRLLRAGGRIGILTILARSAPQAYAIYQEMVREVGLPDVPLGALGEIDAITGPLGEGGAQVDCVFSHQFRLEFADGYALSSWLEVSGIAATSTLSALPSSVTVALWNDFAQRIERFREGSIIPLDFELAGVVARRY